MWGGVLLILIKTAVSCADSWRVHAKYLVTVTILAHLVTFLGPQQQSERESMWCWEGVPYRKPWSTPKSWRTGASVWIGWVWVGRSWSGVGTIKNKKLRDCVSQHPRTSLADSRWEGHVTTVGSKCSDFMNPSDPWPQIPPDFRVKNFQNFSKIFENYDDEKTSQKI